MLEHNILERIKSGEENRDAFQKTNFFKSGVKILVEFYFVSFYRQLNCIANWYFIPFWCGKTTKVQQLWHFELQISRRVRLLDFGQEFFSDYKLSFLEQKSCSKSIYFPWFWCFNLWTTHLRQSETDLPKVRGA